MKNKILNVAVFTAITCSSSVSLANAYPNQYLLLANNESSSIKNVMSDTAITASIKRKLLYDDKVSSLDIHVTTVNGKVTLTGKVPDELARQRAISIAKDSASVKEVISKIEIDNSSAIKNIPSDTNITTKIKLKLLDDDKVSGLDIHVETINGKVTLTGIVPDEDANERALSIATSTNGVEKVVSKLDVQK